MADKTIKAGATSQSIDIFVEDSSVSTGAGLTGLAFNTSSLVAYYSFTGAAATATAITLATLAAITSAWASGGFKEISSTNMPGAYRLDIPNAALAAGNGPEVIILLKGATNMKPVKIRIQLTAWDDQSTLESQVLNTAMTEAYPVKNNTMTARAALYAIVQYLYEKSIATTTLTVKKRDQSTTAKTATLNSSSAPTSSTEAS